MTSFQNIVSFQPKLVSHAHIIQSDVEALEIAQHLAEQFKTPAVQRDAERILPFDEIFRSSRALIYPSVFTPTPSLVLIR